MNDSPGVAFYTLGCKLNFAETSTIERQFNAKGFRKVDPGKKAEVVIINTCTVTSGADKKCRNIIGKAIRSFPAAYIAVVGCYSQLNADKIAQIPGVDLVLGSDEKFRIFDYAGNFKKRKKASIHSRKITGKGMFSPSYSISGRTRSFLKIQDGCDYFCSYCTIPFARGRSRSASMEEIIDQARVIDKTGVKEVVLTGVNIGDFGRPEEGTFPELLARLEKETDIERFRISSIEPDLLSDGIIDLVAGSQKFAHHFHMPLQSGCDRILKKMNRKYSSSLFTEKLTRIREKMPFAGIGVDVITGFPGETEQDFEETAGFINNFDISYLHVFTYSDREDTRASGFADKVPPGIKDQRSKILHDISDFKRKKFMDLCGGQVHRVLFETINKKGRMSGFTGNYIRVETAADEKFLNRLVDLKLLETGEDNIMKGIIINKK